MNNPKKMTYGELIVEMDTAQTRIEETHRWSALFPNERLTQYDAYVDTWQALKDEQYRRLCA